MIWWAIIYWLTINTIGVGVIVGSMCKKENNALPTEAEDNSHEEYSPDYFKNMVEENNIKAMNNILKQMSDYFSKHTGDSTFTIQWLTYSKVPFSMLSKTFKKYGVKMFDSCNDAFTHESYCYHRTLYVKIIDKEIIR